jgi:hypothetical protein
MNKILKSCLFSFFLIISYYLLITPVMAQGGIIQNKILAPTEGTYATVATNPIAPFIARLWQTLVVVGSLMFIIFLIWGAIDWLMSEGDPEKLKNAKNKIIHTLFGLGLLAASFAIVWFVRTLFGFDLLKIVWPTPQ